MARKYKNKEKIMLKKDISKLVKNNRKEFRMSNYNNIKEYNPYGNQEIKDKKTILEFIETFENNLLRENCFGHLTASTWVLNEDLSKILFLYHNDFKGYIYPGGHADGEENLLKVALKELEEETGLDDVIVYNEIFSLECAPVSNHIKRGENISAHIHHNISYLVIVKNDHMSKIRILETENSSVEWFEISNVDINKLVKWFQPVFVNVREKIISDKDKIRKAIK